MTPATAPVTPLRGLRPTLPITCSVCGRRLGAWSKYQTTHYPYMTQCTEECEVLLGFSEQRRNVPRGWRELPMDLRAPLLAAAMLEEMTS